uniref:FBA_2 domain-containing protein n=1 Tax=Panagrellus redivivus TaxID=6233 RepID=A0A7E4VJS3_PANRE
MSGYYKSPISVLTMDRPQLAEQLMRELLVSMGSNVSNVAGFILKMAVAGTRPLRSVVWYIGKHFDVNCESTHLYFVERYTGKCIMFNDESHLSDIVYSMLDIVVSSPMNILLCLYTSRIYLARPFLSYDAFGLRKLLLRNRCIRDLIICDPDPRIAKIGVQAWPWHTTLTLDVASFTELAMKLTHQPSYLQKLVLNYKNLDFLNLLQNCASFYWTLPEHVEFHFTRYAMFEGSDNNFQSRTPCFTTVKKLSIINKQTKPVSTSDVFNVAGLISMFRNLTHLQVIMKVTGPGSQFVVDRDFYAAMQTLWKADEGRMNQFAKLYVEKVQQAKLGEMHLCSQGLPANDTENTNANIIDWIWGPKAEHEESSRKRKWKH